MANRGRGRRGDGRNNSQLPSAFNQQAFVQAIGIVTATIEQASTTATTIAQACATTTTIAQACATATTIAQASATVGQGGPSNLERFKAHHPLTFKEGGDPMVADHWFR